MRSFNLLVFLILICNIVFGQKYIPTSQSNKALDFDDFLAGVKFAEIITTPELEQSISSNPSGFQVYFGVAEYLESMGFIDVGFTSKMTRKKYLSLCELSSVGVSFNVKGNTVDEFSITFYNCKGEWWRFSSNSLIINNGYGTIKDKTKKNARSYMDTLSRTLIASIARS